MEGQEDSWEGLGLSAELVRIVCEEFKFPIATPVQKAAIPPFLQHKDVVVEAVTGSGKTLSFLLPLLQMILCPSGSSGSIKPPKKHQVGGIIISPTRELAVQTGACLARFSTSLPITYQLLVGGGREVEEDMKACQEEGCNVLVATPGRLEDILKRGVFPDLKSTLQLLILDEADRLLDMGFSASLASIISFLPKQRRTGLYSATMNDSLDELVRTGLRNSHRVTVSSELRVPSSLECNFIVVPEDAKIAHLLSILKTSVDDKIIVYFATCACVDYYGRVVQKLLGDGAGRRIYALHGKMVPKKRTGVVEQFAHSLNGVLLCTDLAARGLDFPDITMVVQVDPPQDPKNFAHRCGRTARSGRSGKSIVMLRENELAYVELIQHRGIPLVESSGLELAPESISEVNNQLRSINEQDRDSYEKSITAFVSFIRSYQEHLCRYIFVFRQLNMVSLANSFGLLRMPRMPELAHFDVKLFTPSTVDPDSIAYSEDKIREEQRQKRLATIKPRDEHRSKKRVANAVPWSKSKDKKEKRQVKKGKVGDRKDKLDPELCKRLKKEAHKEAKELENDWTEYKKEVKSGKGKSNK